MRDTTKDLALPADVLWLLNMNNGRILRWTPILAANINYIDCTANGQPIRMEDMPKNHPWARKTTQELADRIGAAGADPETMIDMGARIKQGIGKRYQQLNYDKAERIRLPGQPIGPLIRINNKIDKRVAKVKQELKRMVHRALDNLGEQYSRDQGDMWVRRRKL